VLKLQRFVGAFSFFYVPLVYVPFDATLNLFSSPSFTKIGSAILQLHAIRFTTREKGHYVATD